MGNPLIRKKKRITRVMRPLDNTNSKIILGANKIIKIDFIKISC